MNSRTYRLGLLFSFMFISGCETTPMMLQATGGSRADGTVRTSFRYDAWTSPTYDPSQGQRIAAKRCKAWGYSDAEAFGPANGQCLQFNSYGTCTLTEMVLEFQCQGRPENVSK